ncbi:MAG: hypothetical protein JNM10_16145 [Planctomycetia bacterium]|nr:hypothetical protein [Planctomycetia bacterium]
MRPLALALAASLLSGLAFAADAAPAAAASTASASIGVISKTHGVSLSDGRTGVGLTVPVDALGLKGSTLAASIFFQDASGKAIPSNDPGYADANGELRVVSRDAKVEADPEALAFAFKVPYGAFPRRAGNGYAVVGQVRVFERTKTGRTLLATSIVQFWVGA